MPDGGTPGGLPPAGRGNAERNSTIADLEYAAFVYVPLMSVGLRNRLEAVWRRAVRCAAGAGFQHELPPLLKGQKAEYCHCFFGPKKGI